ncbi:uncharacterized protein LOC123701168 [Colias croceus]|uniref:uncharacterized protein LOC123701168 n=1 Tax=Colias crocea TaxID=72248 RepID=UPI001E28114C|nr:uncharacterized protein LOC123701168 [Colias croceus]
MVGIILFAIILIPLQLCKSEDYYYYPFNVSRSTLHGIAAYRSALTLDWMAAEDFRQRELAAAFETEAPPARVVSTDCIVYPRPTPGKVGRLMLELLKNLEGDEGTLVSELIQVLVRTKLLVESSIFEAEPDLDSLVKTPMMMMGEPHTTFPRVLAVIWMLTTDPVTTNKYGWCPIKKVNKYLSGAKPYEIAKQMRQLEMVVARARFIMEEFVQSVTPADLYQTTSRKVKRTEKSSTSRRAKKRQKIVATEIPHPKYKLERLQSPQPGQVSPEVEVSRLIVANGCTASTMSVILFVSSLLV